MNVIFLQVSTMFQKLVMEDGTVEIINVFEKQEHKSRPAGLNTVNLLKVSALTPVFLLVSSNFLIFLAY